MANAYQAGREFSALKELAPEPERRDIPYELHVILNTEDDMAKAINVLEERLNLVLRPVPSAPDGLKVGSQAQEVHKSSLCAALIEHNVGLRQQIGRLHNIIDRLDL